MAHATLARCSDDIEASRRFANDVYAVALWGEAQRLHSGGSSSLDFLSAASLLSASCRELLTRHERNPRGHAWRTFFRRLDAFLRDVVPLIERGAPNARASDLEALDRLSDLIAENADLLEDHARDDRALAAIWLDAARELTERFGTDLF